jgi:NADH-quinone oxidoreductase subunit A
MIMATELSEYLPVLILAILGLLFAVLSLTVSSFLRPNRPTPAKLAPYECGIEPERLPQGERFSVSFYVVAMLFIIFDVETIFLFPWAVGFRQLGLFGLAEMAIFIGLVFVAYVYVWKRGGLDWAGAEAPAAITADREAEESRDEPGDEQEKELVRAG